MRLPRLLLGMTVAATLALPVVASHAGSAFGASAPAPCHATALAPTVGRGSAAAGTAYETLLITNYVKGTSSLTGSCSLSGTPTTQFGNFVSSGGLVVFRAVGPAATKLTIAGRGAMIVVKPGAVASVTVGIETAANFPPSKCGKAHVSRVRLRFQSGTTLYYTLKTTAVCTKLASTTTSGVVLGTRYP
ncbi:MAG: hypothetical protein HKL85_07570 [Acidimicrobiaceae bacterium]|nr:hypothetical protein [Acidimicrobiaceae bacterium]